MQQAKNIFKLIAIAIAKLILPILWQRWEQQKSRLDDWAQLQIYHQHNLALPPPTTGENRIVFFGDSITEFWDLESTFPDKKYINRGISAQTTPQMLVRFRPDVLSLQPRVVVILAGINDIAGNTGATTLDMVEGNYISFSELAQMNHIQVIFGSVLPINDWSALNQTEPQANLKICTLNSWLKNYCQKHQHVYLDYHNHMVDDTGRLRTELSDDGLHPNTKGYEVMAELVEDAIKKAIAQI
ncbi:GDSL-type esterase/lipase family protein [Pseudanabaena yagii]|uniref:Capsular biosynthesis protein n=1 Tax=Pseudanabaena yagii GIHE-NHR1 TaxID=2722753 RepID=A0ABX1LWG7_9CYAN|nr:GDSL-type esterase/lipase family protein [Pseudanabaena yagii]NMF60542.1 capsular biosynthesis protein [Pseudanabaena yagii GIHE-NHR1]